MRGEVVHFVLHDVGARIHLDRIGRILDELPVMARVESRKAAPKYLSFPRPLVVTFPPAVLDTSMGRLTLALTAKVYSIGAISYAVRVPFDRASLADLIPYGELAVQDGEERVPLAEWIARFHRKIVDNLRPAFHEPYVVQSTPEEYTVFCLTETEATAEQLVQDHRAEVAALLAGEPRAERLSPKEVDDGVRQWYSYYKSDLLVVDWDAALLVEPTGPYEDVLFVLELANLQLLELRVYDAYLDRILDKAYDDMELFISRRGLLASPKAVIKELGDARIELIEVADEIHNIGKFFGDWYLAKIYEAAKERFHLGPWEATVNGKLRGVNDLYVLASHENQNRRMLLLEALIVILFVLDLLALVVVR